MNSGLSASGVVRFAVALALDDFALALLHAPLAFELGGVWGTFFRAAFAGTLKYLKYAWRAFLGSSFILNPKKWG